MITRYINTIARLEKEHGKMASALGIGILLVMLLIGIMIALFGLHIASKAAIQLLELLNDLFY